jgi:hypothetical protein
VTIDEMQANSGYVACAQRILRDFGRRDGVVAEVVAEDFGGDADAFKTWADDFLDNAFGVAG